MQLQLVVFTLLVVVFQQPVILLPSKQQITPKKTHIQLGKAKQLPKLMSQ